MGSIDKERDNRRTTLIAKTELSWEDLSGMLHVAPGTMEDTSRGGACIRVSTEFQVGTRITVKRRTEHFAGVVRYCRQDGEECVIGIERENKSSPDKFIPPAEAAVTVSILTVPPPPTSPAPPLIKTQPVPVPQPVESAVQPAVGPAPVKPVPTPYQELTSPVVALQVSPETKISPQPDPESEIDTKQEVQTTADPQPVQLPQLTERDPGESHERKTMDTKWLHLPSRRRPQPVPSGNANGSLEPSVSTHTDPLPIKPHIASPETKSHVRARGALLPLEDIYRAAGIPSPREGCSINRVVEMLANDHIRDLSEEVKRASVMMALESSGISVAEVLKDATLRLDAITGYETNQRILLDEFETRKANENAQIQAEMERETARYLERMKQNLGEVAAERETLSRWQTAKQREAQRISDAVAVCTERPVAAVPAQTMAAAHGIGVVGKSS